MRVDCIILAGGKSRRMGTCKALTRFDGEPMITTVHGNVKPLFKRIIIAVKNDSQKRAIERILHCSFAIDGSRAFSPAIGMKAGAAHSDAGAFFVIACDMPHVRRSTIGRLIAHAAGHDCTVYSNGEHYEPLCAIYSRRFINALRATDGIQEAIRAEKNKKVLKAKSAWEFANLNNLEELKNGPGGIFTEPQGASPLQF